MSVQAFVAALAVALQGAPAATIAQVRVVERLYAQKTTPTHVAHLFARDLAEAYRKDTSTPGEVGAIDFDWRYGAQDFEIAGLKVEAVRLAPGQAPMAGGGLVRATFRNMGKPGEVTYRFCRRPDGAWRIADVWSKDGPEPWDLRKMLALDPDRVRC